MKGININDRTQDFTGQILRKEKVIETRNSPSLKPYVGKRVGLVRTGKGDATLVGFATVGEPVVYNSLAQFRKDFSRHKVKKGSEFDFKCQKYGYPMIDVEPTTNRKIVSRGIVARQINPVMRKTPKKRKTNPIMRSKLSKIIEPEDRILNYDTGSGEDFYRLWDLIYTASHLNEDALQELEGMLDDKGVLVIETGEEPDNLLKHFKRKTKYQGMLLVQGPISPEKARINTEKLRNE